MKIALLLSVIGMTLAIHRIDPRIFQNLQSKGTSNVIVSFKNSNLAKVRVSFIAKYKSADRPTRLNAFYRTHKDHADKTQAGLLSSLTKATSWTSIQVHQLWATNQIIIMNATKEIIALLEKSKDVSRVENDRMIPLHMSREATSERKQEYCTPDSNGLQWGIAKVEAMKVWNEGIRGQGVVVSNTDTGVRYTHEALRENFRTEYGWLDAYEGTTLPNDGLGHGTHTMGTLVGKKNGIGMAPDAQWVACKGCDEDGFCSTAALLRCGQWTLCPTDPAGKNENCTMAPQISANSWGFISGNNFYDDILAGYDSVGIIPIFSIGNSGPECQSTSYPGESPLVIGVGATSADNTITKFSSVGPPSYSNSTIKPEVSAPGNNVCSASSESDNGYTVLSGTSMACPHVAGLTALLLSKDKNIQVNRLRGCIMEGAQPTNPGGGHCGGIPDDKYPNFHAGHGRISAPVSLKRCFPSVPF